MPKKSKVAKIGASMLGIVVGAVVGFALGFPIAELFVRPYFPEDSNAYLVINFAGLWPLFLTLVSTTGVGAIVGLLVVLRSLKREESLDRMK